MVHTIEDRCEVYACWYNVLYMIMSLLEAIYIEREIVCAMCRFSLFLTMHMLIISTKKLARE